ncbi:TetR/AcrR family transcriptional regulator [Streptomyces sp. 4N509B]|uniref:TetR/AcrR family transcriptional regulator n=1 Tax=Streptomyces sp. 4N509B TaxID=3457413 RepID=UPI003FD00F6B
MGRTRATTPETSGTPEPSGTPIQGVRERARREVTAAIKEEARRRLAAEGAAKLSLRAVARELGMVSSALYRYFPSRDELLTALIVDAYDAMGDAAERALTRGGDEADASPEASPDASPEVSPEASPVARWVALCRAVRAWALAHPHEFALIHGTPVPGYAAPRDTVGPGTRLPIALLGLVREASREGRLGAPVGGPLPEEVWADMARLAEEYAPELPPEVLAAVVAAWAQLVGLVAFEVFGQFTGVTADETREAFFDHTATGLAHGVGL